VSTSGHFAEVRIEVDAAGQLGELEDSRGMKATVKTFRPAPPPPS